jgi:CheY-like chemotaxis protein
VLEELHRTLPDLPVILLTADAIAAQSDWQARGARTVLTKPINVRQITEELERALAARVVS